MYKEDQKRVFFVDLGVYTKNRAFRLFGSSKFGKNTALTMTAYDRRLYGGTGAGPVAGGGGGGAKTTNGQPESLKQQQHWVLSRSFVVPYDLYTRVSDNMWSTLSSPESGSLENGLERGFEIGSVATQGGSTDRPMHIVSEDQLLNVLSDQCNDDDDKQQPPPPSPPQHPHQNTTNNLGRPSNIPTSNMGNMTIARLFDRPSPACSSPSYSHHVPISHTSYLYLSHGVNTHHPGRFPPSMHHRSQTSNGLTFNDISGKPLSTTVSTYSTTSSSYWNNNKILSSRNHSPMDLSPFPSVDQFVRSQANIGGVQGEISSWYLYTGKSR